MKKYEYCKPCAEKGRITRFPHRSKKRKVPSRIEHLRKFHGIPATLGNYTRYMSKEKPLIEEK